MKDLLNLIAHSKPLIVTLSICSVITVTGVLVTLNNIIAADQVSVEIGSLKIEIYRGDKGDH